MSAEGRTHWFPRSVPPVRNGWYECSVQISLGIVRVRTKTDLYDKVKRGYSVTIIGHRRSTKMEVEKEHPSLHCAIADAINEAREMGLGEPG